MRRCFHFVSKRPPVGKLKSWDRVKSCNPTDTNGHRRPYRLEIAGDWQAAANAWRMLGCPYEHATVLGMYGAEDDQRQALTIFEQLGAAAAARLLRQHVRVRGVRGVPRGRRTSTRHNRFGLTRREAEILSLLSQGGRTALIAKRLLVSRKTVEHHISAILGKLGVSSRAEAVAPGTSAG
jgi:DNA-binding CsgD family transcriptional regulator